MVDRPVEGSCWVVWTSVGEDRASLFIASPVAARPGEMPDTFFGLHHVKPFLTEEDAIAAAIILTNEVEAWFVDRVDYPGATRTRVR